MSDSSDALLPVLVAELADESARAMVAELAAARATCLVPLIDAPVDASLHVLEVTTPDNAEPLLVLAEPLGAPTERGFPLRLHPYDSPPARRSLPPPPGAPALPSLRATRTRPATLTKHHTRDLAGDYASADRAETGAPEDLVGRELGGKLVVEALVGVGGMGAVYRARHKQLGTTIAVKVLHERFRADLQFCARFHAEALLVSQLDHPNVVRVTDYGQEPDGLLYIAMDFLEGVELQEKLLRAGTLPLPRIIDIAMQVSAGLGHAHARGIIHRDVKPSNIVLVKSDDDEGESVELVKVCDFGIAARTGANDRLGTPAYMSPQQCLGSEVDGRSDIYSLGVIMYELATGQLPFSSADEDKVIAMHREAPPPPPSSVRTVDKRLEALILRMLSKSPSERPESMRELRGELRSLMRPPSLQLHDVGTGRAERKSNRPGEAVAASVSERSVAAAQVLESVESLESLESPSPPYPQSVAGMEAVIDPRALATQLTNEPVSTLREKLSSLERFQAEATTIAAALAWMLAHKELAALAHVVAIFRKIAADPRDVRAELSARIVRSLQDPARLAPVAEHALAEHDDAAPALLASLGLAAAHALYAARIRAHPTPPVRGRFVSAMRGIGAASWPLVSAALSRNAPGDTTQHDHRLAEDLLRSMPLVADEAAGGVVSKYLRWGDAAVRRAAVPPLVTLWGDRARPLLLGVLLKDPDEGARVAAIRGLRDLHAIDEHVIRKGEDLLAKAASAPGASSTSTSSNAVRIAVAEALGEARDEARPLAAAVLRRALSPKGGMFGVLRGKSPSAPGPVLVALAASYVALEGADATKLVDELGRACDEPLRTQLLGLVGTRS